MSDWYPGADEDEDDEAFDWAESAESSGYDIAEPTEEQILKAHGLGDREEDDYSEDSFP